MNTAFSCVERWCKCSSESDHGEIKHILHDWTLIGLLIAEIWKEEGNSPHPRADVSNSPAEVGSMCGPRSVVN